MRKSKVFLAGLLAGATLGGLAAMMYLKDARTLRHSRFNAYQQSMLAPMVRLGCSAFVEESLIKHREVLRRAPEDHTRSLDLLETNYLLSVVKKCQGDAPASLQFKEEARGNCESFRTECHDRYLEAAGMRSLAPLIERSTASDSDEDDQKDGDGVNDESPDENK